MKLLSSLKKQLFCIRKLCERKKKKQDEEVLQAEELRKISLKSSKETHQRKKTEEDKTRKVRGTETMQYLRERAIKDDEIKREEILLNKDELQLQWRLLLC